MNVYRLLSSNNYFMEILQQNPKLGIQRDGEQKYFCTCQNIYLVKNFRINHKGKTYNSLNFRFPN